MKINLKENISLKQASTLQERLGSPKLLDCGFLRLSDWNSNGSFGTFWHIYWNSASGASILFEGKRYHLNSHTVYLIPAYTSFSTKLTKTLRHFYIDFSVDGYIAGLKKDIYSFPDDYFKTWLPLFIQAKKK